ncbi:MAG: hypothetical protein RLZZ447_611 [Verrucomicrobiota bacterium]
MSVAIASVMSSGRNLDSDKQAGRSATKISPRNLRRRRRRKLPPPERGPSGGRQKKAPALAGRRLNWRPHGESNPALKIENLLS